METTGQIIAWFFTFIIACGLLFSYTLIEDLFRQWRTRRNKIDTSRQPVTKPLPSTASAKETLPPIRGFDSPELFRNDALIRIERLEVEIEEDIRKMKERG